MNSFLEKLYPEFIDYISFNCNRCDFIISYLEKHGIKAVIMPVDGKKHIYVKFPQSAYDPMFKIKTVIAHYDRVEGSPGANDNSAADFCLMQWACRLMDYEGTHNVRLIFTDGEEFGASAGEKPTVSGQGAYGLASIFRRLGITDEDVYVFDCMGRGTVPVMGRSVLPPEAPDEFKNRFFDLKTRTEILLRKVSAEKFVSLPIGYSDNAGFLACGIPAAVITMLPEEEASKYMLGLVKYPELEPFIMRKKVSEKLDKSVLEEYIPLTWQLLHTEKDCASSLHDESFYITGKILDTLCKTKIII